MTVRVARPQKPTGTHFYRYGRVNVPERLSWLKDIILTHWIYVPTAQELNDPRDCRPRLTALPTQDIIDFLFRDVRRRMPSATPYELAFHLNEIRKAAAFQGRDALMAGITKGLHERLSLARVYSMGQRWDHMAMWANYADGHAGYCMELANVMPFSAARLVTYDDSVTMDLRTEEAITARWMFAKRKDWAYEEEVRIVLPRSMNATHLHISPDAFSRVILGERMSAEHRQQIQEWARTRTPQLPVFNARFDSYRSELMLSPA